MATEPSKVELLIEQMVQEKTFSLDALEAVKKLRDAAGIQSARLMQLEKDLETFNKVNAELKTANATLLSRVDTLTAREVAVASREATMTKLELERAVALAKAETFNHCFDKVFANRQIRESVTEVGNRAIMNPNNSYPSSAPENNSVTRTVEES